MTINVYRPNSNWIPLARKITNEDTSIESEIDFSPYHKTATQSDTSASVSC